MVYMKQLAEMLYCRIGFILAIIGLSTSTIVKLHAKKITGFIGSPSVYDAKMENDRWIDCLRFCQILGKRKCQIVAVNIKTRICRLIDHTSYTLTYNTQWDIFNMGK